MKKIIINEIERITDIFSIKKISTGKSIITLVYKYAPFKHLEFTKYAQIDAYYFASNECYFKSLELISLIKKIGINANILNSIDIKSYAVKNLDFVQGINSICYLRDIGSRFVFQLIEIDTEINYKKNIRGTSIDCSKCLACVSACPTSAISPTEGINPYKCIRYFQRPNNIDLLKNKRALKNMLLGCDICQKVCPHNGKVKSIDMDSAIKDIFKFDNLSKSIYENNACATLSKYIGKNYAKKNQLLPVLNVNLENRKNIYSENKKK